MVPAMPRMALLKMPEIRVMINDDLMNTHW